ncbi:MAG: hypothetical protein QOG69_1748, partial [Actinomycetota bacterium]|nr:hypothetical protein [Actinomycetota bacterium]
MLNSVRFVALCSLVAVVSVGVPAAGGS